MPGGAAPSAGPSMNMSAQEVGSGRPVDLIKFAQSAGRGVQPDRFRRKRSITAQALPNW